MELVNELLERVPTANEFAHRIDRGRRSTASVMLPKSESVADFDALTELEVIGLCETALDCVVALMWGA